MTDIPMLKKQISMQATRLAECIRKINQLTSDLHQAREEVKRLRDGLRIGEFVLRDSPTGVWIGRTDGEGGAFASEKVERVIKQFYRENF